MSEINPCTCVGAVISVVPVCPSSSVGECLLACTGFLPCENSVGPCGKTGTFDLSTLSHDTSGCKEPVVIKWGLIEYDKEILAAASINPSTGILTFVTREDLKSSPGASIVGKFAEICFSMECISSSDDCLPLKDVQSFFVGIKDECIGVICDDECQTCDPCDGICKDNDVVLEAGAGSSNSELIAIAKNN